MSIIEISDFSQSFGDKIIYDNANFVLNNNEKIGIVGLNGAGKSTLLKILEGDVLVDNGKIYKNPRYRIKYLDQHAEIEDDLTIKEYLAGAFAELFKTEEKLNEINEKLASETNDAKIQKLLEKSGELYEKLLENDFYTIDSNINKVANGLGVTAFGLDTKISTLSGGQRAKVILSKLLLEDPEVMVLDEPTNFLDVNHIDWLAKYIKASEKCFIIVSHDETFLNSAVTHICDVENGKINKYLGNLVKVKELKAEQRLHLEKAYENQQKEIKKLQDYIDKNKARASTANMAKSREKKLEKMDKITPPSDRIKPTFSFAVKEFAGNLMLKVENLVVGYTKPLLKKPVSFELVNGDRLAITGFNGIGKSTLLKTIMGIIPALDGRFEVSRNVILGYYEQENNFNHFEGTPLTFIFNKFPNLTEKNIRASLFKSGLSSEHCRKQIKTLSGGEQSKIKICELTLKPSNLLILDEPTNHLDVLAIERLEEAMKEYKGAIIFVSHDKEFVRNNATKIYDLEKNV